MSLKSTLKTSRRNKPLLIVRFDISRAHFMPKAEKDVYVEIPDEDPAKRPNLVVNYYGLGMALKIQATYGKSTTLI